VNVRSAATPPIVEIADPVFSIFSTRPPATRLPQSRLSVPIT
jgi:hypothetical protein